MHVGYKSPITNYMKIPVIARLVANIHIIKKMCLQLLFELTIPYTFPFHGDVIKEGIPHLSFFYFQGDHLKK